jgi:hypothetical protein
MRSLFNPYEQFSIYPLDDYGDHGGLLSHDLTLPATDGETAEEQARQSHPSAQQIDSEMKRRNDLRELLAS